MKKLLFAAAALAALGLASCHGGKGNNGEFPDNFNSIGDAGRVAYVMENSSPDSVARFICRAALGEIEGARIDTFANATLYAYDHYRDDDLAAFSSEFDSYSASLPLPKKMKIYSLAAKTDPQGLGYQLGLEYVNNIRTRKMTADEVAAELKDFRRACATDPQTYHRFVKGFKIVLEMERNNGVPSDVYARFINMSEE